MDLKGTLKAMGYMHLLFDWGAAAGFLVASEIVDRF